ncbi:MAG: amidohydrolase [Clostridiales bacterium]|nr:amidohydrolase [Clostridiales bacterium]
MDSVSLSYLTVTRRKLHALAELSGEEYKTSAFIVDELKSFGYKPKTIGTGVYCDAGKGNGRLAFRADFDALPIKENVAVTGCDFAAEGEVMHACGHDGHTANLLNLARIYSITPPPVPLRFIFQFGEEGIGGSETMIDGGVLDGVDEIYALHLCPELDMGKVGYCYGGTFAGCVEFDFEITGRAAHCATPEKGADAIRAALYVADAAIKIAEDKGLLINLGKIEGGAARNIVAQSCKCFYTLRFFDSAACEEVMLNIERALIAADERYGTSHRIITNAVYPPLINDALSVDKVRKVMGDAAVAVPPRYTAEDFSNYLLKVPGCIVWLGTGKDGMRSPLHSDTFAFDEKALLLGTELFQKLVDFRAGRKA